MEALAQVLAPRIAALLKPAPFRDVLNVREAAAMVGKANCKDPIKAFYNWRKKLGIKPVGMGRYTLRSIKAGLEREGRRTYVHAA
jgi:hypothetical protein